MQSQLPFGDPDANGSVTLHVSVWHAGFSIAPIHRPFTFASSSSGFLTHYDGGQQGNEEEEAGAR